MPRVYVGGVWHETHSFASDTTLLEHFQHYKCVESRELVESFSGTSTEIGGAIGLFRDEAAEVVGGFYAGALPSGPVDPDAWSHIESSLLRSIEAARPDAIFLALHGAMVVRGADDPEGDLIRSIRDRVGDAVPIGVTLDFHANLGPDLVWAADAVVAYDTYPHSDFAERGAEVAGILLRILRGERFSRGIVQIPVAPPVPAQATAEAPMRDLLAHAHRLEARGTVEVASWMAGFPYSDVPRMGMSAVALSRGEPAELAVVLDELARDAWDRRSDFRTEAMPVDEAVRAAAAAPEGPVILVDVADNVGGGTPGDGTAILESLIRHKVRGSVVTIADRESVEIARAAGVGGRVRLFVGGKTDAFHGAPVPMQARVRWMGDGRFVLRGSWMKGTPLDPGYCALIESDEGVFVILTERKVPPFDDGLHHTVGLPPETCRVIVAKSAIAWQAAFGGVAKAEYYVDTPGICTPRIERLPYARRRSPLLPFDPETSLDDIRLHVWGPRERSRVAP